MIKLLKTNILLFLVGIATETTAQERTINKENEYWLQYHAQVKLHDKWILPANVTAVQFKKINLTINDQAFTFLM